MSILVAISSCEQFEREGLNDPLRKTWLPDLAAVGWDFKFFHGTGSTPKDDVVVLNVVDELYGLTEKLKGKLRYAVEHGYDYVLSCFPDTYASAQRLHDCGFEQHSYMGNVHRFMNSAPFCQGGVGYFIDRRACEIAINDVSSYLNDDCWLGDVLYAAGIKAEHNPGFANFGPGPTKQNTSIANHLSTQPGGFKAEAMYEEHKRWLESFAVSPASG